MTSGELSDTPMYVDCRVLELLLTVGVLKTWQENFKRTLELSFKQPIFIISLLEYFFSKKKKKLPRDNSFRNIDYIKRFANVKLTLIC